MHRSGRRASLIALAVGWLVAVPARGGSELHLTYPPNLGSIPASTYDATGQRVGDAHLIVEKLDNGHVRIFSESGYSGGARTVAEAELVPIDSGRSLRPLRQQSRSFDPDGTPLGVLTVDHRDGRGSCAHPNGDGMSTRSLPLPSADRIVNVPLHLLFLPLVRGEAERTTFQLLMCSGGTPRLLDFEAWVARSASGTNGSGHVIEVRYRPDFGSVLSIVARGFVPKLSFWFEPQRPFGWMAHRMPLYASGPEVLVIRDGVPKDWVTDQN
jgi:hypothetical protein